MEEVTDPLILQQLNSGTPASTLTPADPRVASALDDPGYTGSILPIHRDPQGNYSLAVPGAISGLFDAAKSAVTAPADALNGELPMVGRQGGPNPAAIDRAIDTASMFSPQGAAARAGEIVPGTITKELGAPSTRQLKSAAGAGYDAARASTATVPGSDITTMAQGVKDDLFGNHGIIPENAPQTYALLDKLTTAPAGGPGAGEAFGTYPGLAAAREGFSGIAGSGGTDGLAAQKAIAGLDKLIDPAYPTAADARANYAAAMRSNLINGDLDKANTGVIERAENQAHASHSGANIDNSIRQRVNQLVSNPSKVSGFSPEEIDALNGVVAGSGTQNILRATSNLLGGGGGLGAGVGAALGLGLGHHFFGPEGGEIGLMLAPALGRGTKAIENSLSRRNLDDVDELIRQRSPLYQALQAQGGLLAQPSMGANRAAMTFAWPGLLGSMQQQQQP